MTVPTAGDGQLAPTRRLLALSASAFAVLAAEPLYLLVDTAVVGHLGARDLAGLGVGAALMTLLTIVGTFVEYGTTSRAARAYGAGRTDAAVREGVQASWLAAGIGVVLVAAGEVFAGPLTGLLAGGGPVHHTAEQWFRVAVLGLPGVLLVLAGNGWMRGVQRTREPVVIVVAANGLSAVLCPLFVYPLGWGLTGSAVANVVAQAVGGVLFVLALRRTGTSLRPDTTVMWAQAVVGRDLVIRAAAFQVAFLTAAGVASRMGTAQIGAHQIGLQLWDFTALLLDSFAIAAQSLVGAALGAADPATARAMSWQVSRWGLYAGGALAVVFGAGTLVIPGLFTSSDAVVDQAHVLWPWLVAMLPLAGVVFALDGVLIGAGDVGYLRTVTIVAAVFAFAPLNLLALRLDWGLGGVWAGLSSFIVVRLVGMLWRVRGERWLVVGAHDPAG
ncbi:putative efflux protein, MATE family [Jatrophihabitans endophyticus]|uniref:Putative efflux protein, MATE family n=1 Tax=Jatrophihabitans endophyticus TaxID=1206085 RepID=A0A1M5MHA8_9ACTN|nr:MATE family efflux transporter [Jatrophihabitans endophyticus]SHG76113.1 putative efflux protein, MATE family [Jatrophihabitans endophyticus]